MALFFGLIKLAVAGMICALGAALPARSALYLWQRPRLLMRTLLAMYAAVPLAAVLIDEFVPLGPLARAALLVLAVSAGAPMLPRKLGPLGNSPYLFSMVVTSSVLAVAVVPAWVMWLGEHFQLDRSVSPALIAGAVGRTLLLPLFVGMLLRGLWPVPCERWANRILAVFGTLLMGLGVILIAIFGGALAQIPLRAFAALGSLLLVALAAGHLLGGPDPDERTALAITCATRHVGLAALFAASMPGPNAALVVTAYMLCSLVVTTPYLLWRRARTRKP
nr:hypothetical protein [Niveibacterium umoris]